MTRQLALGTGLALGVAALGLGQQLMEVDPAQYALVAWNVARTGDWWHLTDLNGPFLNKPPLMIHAQALAMLALGPTSAAARLPALLFAALAAAGTWWVGHQLGGPRLGARAALLLSASVAVQHMVADPKVDLPLVAMSALAVGALLAGRARPAYTVLGWAFTALAVLAKGPVGAFLVAAGAGVELWRTGPGRPLAHGLGLLVALALAVPFYAAVGASRGTGAVWYLLWSQGPGRLLAGAEFRDGTTPLYAVHTALWALLPMTPAVLLALVRRRGGAALPRWWLGLTLGLVAVSPYKLPQYVYWAAVPAALLAAEAVEALPRWVAPALAGLGLGLGALLGGVVFPAPPLAALGLALALLAAVVGALALREPALRLAASTAGFLLCYQAWVHPALLAYQPAEAVGTRVQAASPPGAPLQLLEVPRSSSLAFYGQRALRVVEPGGVQPGLVLASEEAAAALEARGASVERLGRWLSYPVSLPRRAFLDPASREGAVRPVALLRVAGP
jgi:4-amino-4-deoxy-L-arabinose transferase-like glycosyltransferase